MTYLTYLLHPVNTTCKWVNATTEREHKNIMKKYMNDRFASLSRLFHEHCM
jgi:hypothetical protein